MTSTQRTKTPASHGFPVRRRPANRARAARLLGHAVLILIAAPLAAAACGSGADAGAGTAPACIAPAAPQVPNTDATVHQDDNGKVICLHTDQHLVAFLGKPGQATPKFDPVSSSDEGLLEPETNTAMTLPMGVTAGFFHATGPGTATLSTTASNGTHWQVQVVIKSN